MKKTAFFVAAAMALCAALSGCAKKEKIVINSSADLAGKKIGVQAGTTGEICVQEMFTDAEIKSFKTAIDAAIALRNGSVDAVVVDELPARSIVEKMQDLDIVTDDFASEEYSIAVKKGNTKLLDSINSTIAQIKADGTYDMMISSFMPADGKIIIPSIEEKNSQGKLRMGTNAAWPPFEYIEGTKVVGFDVSLSQLIANDWGTKLEIVDMAFDGLIAALQADAIDFIASGMTATDERRKNVDFSEPYYKTNQVILVRK